MLVYLQNSISSEMARYAFVVQTHLVRETLRPLHFPRGVDNHALPGGNHIWSTHLRCYREKKDRHLSPGAGLICRFFHFLIPHLPYPTIISIHYFFRLFGVDSSSTRLSGVYPFRILFLSDSAFVVCFTFY